MLSDLAYTLLATAGGQLLGSKLRRLIHRAGAGSLIGASVLIAATRRQ